MHLNPNATATICIEGLAMSCCNARDELWQFAFLRIDGHHEHKHKLELIIKEAKPDGTFVLHPSVLIPLETRRVRIEVEKARPQPTMKYEVGDFVRQGGANHPLDFRWILDIGNSELPHQDLQLIRPNPGRVPVTLLEIPSAVCYTKLITDRPLNLLAYPGKGANQSEIGRVGTIAGADIECEDGGSVAVKVEGMESITLPRLPGRTHEIAFANLRVEDAPFCPNHIAPPSKPYEDSDFNLYYQIVSDQSGKTYDLADANPAVTDGGRVVCNKSFVSRFNDLSHLL